jgi:transposase
VIKIQKLTKTEQKTLKNHYRHSQTALTRERAHAVLLSAAGHTVPKIANILFRDTDAIYRWIAAFAEMRIASIFPGYADNQNAVKLSKEQKEEVKQTLVKTNGLPASFWTLPKFKEYIKGEFKIVYESDRSYHYLLEYCGYSFKLPSPFDKRRKDDEAQKQLTEIHKKLKKYKDKQDGVILVADEVVISFVTELRRAWLRRGQKTVIKINREKVNQSYFGALNLKTGKAHNIRLSWQNQTEIGKALMKLIKLYPDKHICIVWDNAKWHKGKELQALLGSGQPLERIHLVNFPPYSPDCNPQELIWKFGKEHIANTAQDSFEVLLKTFERSISKKTFNYKIPEFVLR